jgi:hypothetical protein
MTLEISGAVIGASTMLTALKGSVEKLAVTGMIDAKTAMKAIADIDAVRASIFSAIIPNAIGHDWLLGLCGFYGDGTVIPPNKQTSTPVEAGSVN